MKDKKIDVDPVGGRVIWAIATILLTAAAVISLRAFLREPPEYDGWKPVTVPNWEVYSSNGFRQGPDSAEVVIVVFSDFQCQYCRSVQSRLDTIRLFYPNSVRTVFRHFPLGRHAMGYDAAMVVECAGEQGMFLRTKDFLFSRQDSLQYLTRTEIAEGSGVANVLAFDSCIAERRYAEKISQDRATGRDLGIRGTPAVLINGTLFHLPPTLQELREEIDMVLAGEKEGE